jgi:hypothetical protein
VTVKLLFILSRSINHSYGHRHNLANNNGGGGGQNRPWVLESLIYEGVNLERVATLVLTSPLTHKQLFPPTLTQIFFLAPFQLSSLRKNSLRKKILGAIARPLPPHQVMTMLMVTDTCARWHWVLKTIFSGKRLSPAITPLSQSSCPAGTGKDLVLHIQPYDVTVSLKCYNV